jgi:hypothetical protein
MPEAALIRSSQHSAFSIQPNQDPLTAKDAKYAKETSIGFLGDLCVLCGEKGFDLAEC